MAGPNGELSRALARRIRDAAGESGVVVALGGGADSAVLLAVAQEALSAGRVEAVFVHHGLEGSDALAAAAAAVADRCGVPFTNLTAPVSEGPNLEARARHARYSAIESCLRPGFVVLTGHTRDDQAETLLMRMTAGSGSQGLRGIPSERGVWRRPFLGVARAHLAELAEEWELPVADDPANSDPRFTRSRVRHAVIPVLETELPGDARAGLARSAELLGRDDDLLSDLAGGIPVRIGEGSAWIASAPLATAPDPVATRAVRRALRPLLGGYPGTSDDVRAVLETARAHTTSSLSCGLVAFDEGPGIRIEARPPDPPPSRELPTEGTFAWGGSRYAVRRAGAPPTSVEGGRFTLISQAALAGPPIIRAVRPGDRLEIELGTTPVRELLRAHGVAPNRRPVSPLIVDDAKIAAVVGVRTATWARPEPGRPVIVVEREVGT